MLVADLLDHAAHDADDNSAAYRAAALRWLNLARSHIAQAARWRMALRHAETFQTSAATTSGLYPLPAIEHVSGDQLYDITNDQVLRYDGAMTLEAADPTKETLSQPSDWADAGADDQGQRVIYLWPVPNGTFTIRFNGYALLTDITSSQESLSVDPYFGAISPWASTFASGIRLYHDLNNNEGLEQIAVSRQAFDNSIRMRKVGNTIAPESRWVRGNVRNRGSSAWSGRLDPAHYSN